MVSRPNFIPSRSRLNKKSSGSVIQEKGPALRRWSGFGRRAACTAAAELEQPDEQILQLAAVGHHVEHPVLEQELASLESFREFLPDRLLDYPRAGESNQRPRLRDVHVAKHGEARGDTARGRVREDGDV